MILGAVGLILVGLALLVGGANVMIRGATALATALRVPPVVIGLTIVAFGTSAPELVVNSTAAWQGQAQLAFGNVVGSCAINLGWVLALTALVRPVRVEPSIISREIPMMLLATASFCVLALDQFFDGAPENLVTRGNGVILLLLFCVFIYYTIVGMRIGAKTPEPDPYVVEVEGNIQRQKALSTGMSLALTIGGLAALVAGGRLTVYAAVKVAQALGMPEFLIGLTVVSFGTTLPELVTGILATRRGEGDIAIGNVVGSNIFNLLFIGGVVAVISPIPVPPGGGADLGILVLLSLLVLPISMGGTRTVYRWEGALLLVIYFAYLIWRVTSSQ